MDAPTTTIIIDVYHKQLEMNLQELRFQSTKTIKEIKENLYMKTGTEPAFMQLNFTTKDGDEKIFEIMNETETIESIYTEALNKSSSGSVRLEINDLSSNAIMASEFDINNKNANANFMEAKKGDDGFTEFRNQMKSKTTSSIPKKKKIVVTAETGLEDSKKWKLDERIMITSSKKLGIIRYIGECPPAALGYFVGIELVNEATGKNNGTIKGMKLFECDENKGVLLRPDAIVSVEDEM